MVSAAIVCEGYTLTLEVAAEFNLILSLHPPSPHAVVIIGFEQRLYIATEGPEPSIEVCVQLISGQLEREAVVTLVTSDESARGLLNFGVSVSRLRVLTYSYIGVSFKHCCRLCK